MQTITKRADEIKPGDVLVMAEQPTLGTPIPRARHVVLHADSLGRDIVALTCAILGDPDARPLVQKYVYDRQIDVEAPDLTLAQVHAERLLDLLDKWTSEGTTVEALREARDLVAELRPPVPPTLAETLAMLERFGQKKYGVKPGDAAAVDALLDRARRAGVLK